MRQGWCIGLRLPVQLRANNQKGYTQFCMQPNLYEEVPFFLLSTEIDNVSKIIKH